LKPFAVQNFVSSNVSHCEIQNFKMALDGEIAKIKVVALKEINNFVVETIMIFEFIYATKILFEALTFSNSEYLNDLVWRNEHQICSSRWDRQLCNSNFLFKFHWSPKYLFQNSENRIHKRNISTSLSRLNLGWSVARDVCSR